MKRTIQCLLSAVMVLLLLFAVVPAGFMPALAAEKNSLQIGLLSDIHIFPEELTDGYGSAFQKSLGGENKQFEQSEGLLASALAALESHAKKNGMKAVLISGDLTKDGELEGHQKLAKTLKAFEKRSGLQVLVIPGNHDINNIGDSFVGGVHQDGTLTSPEQFREIYKNLGYGEAGATYYQPPAGKKGGMLSYALDLPGGYRLIALDTCKYSKDQTKEGKDYQNTGGMLSKELLAWAVAQSREAVAQGKTVLGMGHHNLTSHMGPEDRIFLDFMLDDWLRVRETLADAGMHFYFSGHIHVGEIGDAVSDSGEALYDVCTAALSTYPNSFRELRFTREGKKISAKVETYDVDCVKPVAANGVTYPQPYTAVSFDLSFDKDGIGEFLTSMVDGSLTPLLEDMQKAGGLSAFLGEQDLDLEGMIDDALNGGVKLGQIDIFTAKNVMGLVNDVLGQVDKNYINQPERLTALLNGMIGELMDMQVSSLPSTQFLQSMGLGDPQKPGTLEDLANEVIVYAYTRQPGAENDRFLMDAIRGFESGDSTDRLISLLLDMILNDLLEEELLPTLKLNLSPVFTQPLLRLTLGTLLDGILRAVLLGDNSFAALVDLVFQLGVLPYDDLQDVVDSFLEEYWSPSQSESIGGELADFMRKFCIDAHDYDDSNTTLVYSGKKKVTPTTEAFQLPSLLVQTFGGDAATTRNISWFTKDTVKGTDLRLTDAKTGKSVLGRVTVQKSSEAVTKTFPGADLGTFGLFDVPNHLVRHTVRLSNLIPGKTYRFQVGDAAKGWWSEQGSIQTADGSKTTTFLSFSDQQAQMETQYARAWGKLSREALRLYPQADFIVSPGDQVDSGTNLRQWQWFFDTAQSTLSKLPLMPVTGNHEESDAAISQFFPMTIQPAQDEETGLYYSYDYNNIHFIVLNTNDLEDDQLSAAQTAWLTADAAASGADWKFVVMHKSIYSNGSHLDDSDVVGLRAQLGKLLPELGIDLVIQGHDHTYLRTQPLNNNKVVAAEDGTVFVTAGASGVKYYNVKSTEETDALFPRAAALADAHGSMFAAYTAENDTLRYAAYLMDETGALKEVDSFVLQKEGIAPFVPPPGWGEAEEEVGLFPDTGESSFFILPLSLLFAAGALLFLLQKERLTAQLHSCGG